MTSKGQVTIPLEIRTKLGLLPDTEVEFHVEGDGVLLKKARRTTGRGRRFIERVTGTADAQLSTDEILALTRGEPRARRARRQ